LVVLELMPGSCRRRLLSPVGENGVGFYHCLSRVVDRNFVFQVHEQEVFRDTLRQVEAFTGVRVITWTILSNHFHVLLEVPPKPRVALTDDEILDRCRALYPKGAMLHVELEFQDAQRRGGVVLERVRQKYLKRMWDLSEFMKTLKQKFTGWFNRKHQRVGTLWESRFKSVVVEGSWKCLLMVAAYIDLNPVRAGIVSDPKDYRFCGYAEAEAGGGCARAGIAAAVRAAGYPKDKGEVAAVRDYRSFLFGRGSQSAPGKGGKAAAIDKRAATEVIESGGKLPLHGVSRLRDRYYTEGAVLGSREFVEGYFRANRKSFGRKRRASSHPMAGAEWGGLAAVRGLREAIE